MYEIFELINKMSPYLLLGFLFAGVMHVFVPGSVYKNYLAKNNFASVFRAALFGVPLPLCSCGVIPTAMSLRREGASKGATVSFLIATPQTGVDSILATYSLMGLTFAILRPITAFITAILGGQLINVFNNDADVDAQISEKEQSRNDMTFGNRILTALHYGFVELVQDIGKWLIIGLIIAGLITVLVPDSFFSSFSDSPLLSYLLVLLFSVPMYLCATGSIPIAVALMLKGLSPGTALVLLMAGPAASAASVLVISKVLGRRTMFLYLLAIIGGAILSALFVDYLLPREWFIEPLRYVESCCDAGFPYFGFACTVLLFILLVNAFIQRRLHATVHSHKVVESAEIPVVRFKIEGMRCNHCRANTEKAIAALPGVVEVTVELDGGIATVKGRVEPGTVISAVTSLGFKGEVI